MELIKKDFSCLKGQMVIRGKEITASQAAGRLPAAIVCHGFTGDMSSTEKYGDVFAQKGYRAFIFDFCGGGFKTISDGTLEDYMTPLTEIDDLKAVIEYVTSRDDVDADSLILMGCSQGGFVAALTAKELKDQVKQLVLFYPALCIPDDARNGSMQVMTFDPENIPHHIGEGKMRVSGAYPRSVLHMDVFEELKGYTGKVLLVHGTGDSIVSHSYSEKAYQVYQDNGANAELFLIEGGQHGYTGEHLAQAKQILRDNTLDF